MVFGGGNLSVLLLKRDYKDADIARARYNKMMGYVDKKGEWIIQSELEKIENWVNGIARVRKSGRWGYVNLDGKWIVQPDRWIDAKDFIEVCN